VFWNSGEMLAQRSSERFYALARLACSVICFNALQQRHGGHQGDAVGHR